MSRRPSAGLGVRERKICLHPDPLALSARHGAFGDEEPALAFLDSMVPPYVIKSDGLAAGKGVIVTEPLTEARNAVGDYLSGSAFGYVGRRIVIEEGRDGPELSGFAVCDGRRAVPVGSALGVTAPA